MNATDSARESSEQMHQGVDELSDFTTVDRRLIFISFLGIVVGVVAAIVAVILLAMIGFFTNLFYYGRISFQFNSPSGNALGLLAIAIPMVGGLIVGLMARYGSERIRGHGIPEALEAILINRSKIEPRVTILKPLSTAISIGSGGPFGAEGPIIMTGGAFGSVFSQFLKLSAMERKTLLVAGAAGGMAATFNSPISAVLIAVELLLFEWKPRSLIPVAAASATATLLRGILISSNPLFPIPLTQVPTLAIVLSSIPVGLIAGLASTALTYAVYAAEDSFRKLPIHWMWWPILGGLVVGIGGVLSPRALGVGYNTIADLLSNNLVISVILVLVVVKATIWAVSLGSGTSGGVLAPLLIIGGALGALESHVLPFGAPSLWVLVSMGAVIGGTMRCPFTGVVFSLELTHDINAVLPLLVGVVAAEGVTVFSMKRSILTEKVARRGVHVAREYSVDVLEFIPVGSVMHRDFNTVRTDTPLEQILAMYQESNGTSLGYPVLDATGSIQGFIRRKDIARITQDSVSKKLTVKDVLSPSSTVPFAFPDEPLRVASDKMARSESESLLVVDLEDPKKVVGLIGTEDLFRARILWSGEEKTRETILSVPKRFTKELFHRTER